MVNITHHRTPPSPRYLTQRHAQRLLSAKTASSEPLPFQPGEEQLYSFYLPSLSAGSYIIKTKQTITIPDTNEQLNLTASQPFNVIVPRYALPSGSIYSVYPPQGHGDIVETLPHVVLTDPHLPWERTASTRKEDDRDRNRVPWLAVLVFTQDELRVDQNAWAGAGLGPAQQSTTLAVNMALSDLDKVCVTPVKSRDGTTKADFIFLRSGLFNALVTDYKGESQEKCDVSRYKWLAHVRRINTEGMANSGVGDGIGVFSIIVSHRVGPLDITQPTPVVVHLVSIEDVEKMAFPVKDGLVGLCSLHSWSYTCLPASSLNVADAFRHLGATMDVLRPNNIIKRLMEPSQPAEAKRVVERMNDGYTLTKYRTQTGEVCAALFRGPFSPTNVDPEEKPLSHYGTDLQVMDKKLGLMDITYSVAWQLGKTLALADQSFTTALGRVRTQIHGETMQSVKAEVLRAAGRFKSRDDTLRGLPDAMENLNNLPRECLVRGPVTRWRREEGEVLNLAFDSDLVNPRFDEHAKAVATKLASSLEGGLYNELNTHINADWMVVFSWVLDRMYLIGIPAHYLIPDPSHLPLESLRFFHIDANWVDALIDGALSVANHIDRDDDQVRRSIKLAINDYLNTPLTGLSYLPQVPTHGFLLRSELCTKYPDLIVDAPISDNADQRAPILRQEYIDESVMLALFDRVPGSDTFDRLIFRQPPHQQSFAAGKKLDIDHIETAYKRVYTILDPPTDDTRKLPISNREYQRADLSANFVWGEKNEIRTLKLPGWVQDVYKTIHDGMPEGQFKDDMPTAALVGIQLNNPIDFLEILLKQRKPMDRPGDSGPRTLLMLEPRLKRAPKSTAIASPTRGASDEDYSALLPAPGNRTRVTQSSQVAGRPPHVRALTTVASDDLEVLRYPATSPKFIYNIYSIGSDTVIMHPRLQQDLIFSIVLKPGTGAQFELAEIDIFICMGEITNGRKNLITSYRGTGANMLSNLRFNVIPTNDTNNRLVLKLLPRSTEGWVAVSVLTEMSFVLNGVVVNDYGKDVEMEVMVVERYYSSQDIPTSFKIKIVREKREV